MSTVILLNFRDLALMLFWCLAQCRYHNLIQSLKWYFHLRHVWLIHSMSFSIHFCGGYINSWMHLPSYCYNSHCTEERELHTGCGYVRHGHLSIVPPSVCGGQWPPQQMGPVPIRRSWHVYRICRKCLIYKNPLNKFAFHVHLYPFKQRWKPQSPHIVFMGTQNTS